MSDTYYSTQTQLADEVAGIYGQYFVYIAKGFDLPDNDPSSNPKTIREWWCQIAAGQTVYLAETFSDIWYEHRKRLKFYAQKYFEAGTIRYDAMRKIQQAVNDAQLKDAIPVVYIIPVANIHPDRVREGDAKPNYPQNEEYIIPDLVDSDGFRKDKTPCDQPLNV